MVVCLEIRFAKNETALHFGFFGVSEIQVSKNLVALSKEKIGGKKESRMGDKKRKREKDDEIDLPKISSVNYGAVSDRLILDKRFEREQQSTTAETAGKKGVMSSTFDAFHRMAAGLEGRKLADKMNDPNRPTWEQYKKENEDKLDIVGDDIRKMAEYRLQLDREREKLLKERRSGSVPIQDSDSEEEEEKGSDDDDSEDSSKRRRKHKKRRKEKKSKKSKKKHKKESKSKKHSDSDDDASSS